MQRILTPDLQKDLDSGRELLSELRGALARFGASEPDLVALDSSIRQLDELFLLVVVGEFNAGKSAFINAIAGQAILREGVTPTTARIHVLKHGESVLQETETEGVSVTTAPVELLRDVHIVDTPGTNAIIREHEQLTTHFVPRADLVLFVTSADRPFTETERALFELIRGWGLPGCRCARPRRCSASRHLVSTRNGSECLEILPGRTLQIANETAAVDLPNSCSGISS